MDRAGRGDRRHRHRHGGARPLIDRFIAWLSAFPPAAIYLALAVLTALENLFPFVPSDIAVLVVAALLVREGPLDPWTLWASVTLGNAVGSLAPWAIARRFGPRIAQSRLGRRLLPADTVSLVEREYVRFGLPGIFLCRLLPGVRFIVAPFAGLVGIGLFQTLVPLGIAASVWYAIIVGGGWLVGGQRAALVKYMRDVNVGLAVVGVLAVAAVVVWWYRRRDRVGQAAGERLGAALESALAQVKAPPAHAAPDAPLAASTLLLVELAAVDQEFDPAALAALEAHAMAHWGLGPLRRGQTPDVEYLAHARAAAASTDHADRIALAAEVWRSALADGVLSEHEQALLDRIAAFLSLTPDEIAAARRSSRAQRTP